MKRSLAVFIVLLGFPLVMSAIDNLFYVSFASRVIIYAIAATSLNLVLGYGGMISFGHAAFVGAGAYAASICIAEGVTSAWLGWPAGDRRRGARGVADRRGVAAHARRVLHHDHARLRADGVLTRQFDEGVRRRRRLEPAAARRAGPGLDLGNEVVFYYVVLFFLAVSLYGLHRVMQSRFGRVVIAIRENEARAEAIGLPVHRYPARLLRHRRRGRRARRGAPREPRQVRQPERAALGAVRHADDHGDPGRGRPALGRRHRRVRAPRLEHVISDYPIPWLAAVAPNYQQHANLGVGLVMLAVVLFAPQGVAAAAVAEARCLS